MTASVRSARQWSTGGDAPRRPWRESAYWRLVAADTKDVVRTLQTGFASLFLFVFFLAIIMVIDALFTLAATTPKVAIVSPEASFVAAVESSLTADGIALVDPDAATVVVSQQHGHVDLVVDAQANPQWNGVWRAVRSTGAAVADITVIDTDGVWRADIVQQNLAPAIGMGLMAIAFVGTAVPLVSMRERGILRLLGTTPVRSSTFVLALIPARFAVAVVEIAVVLAIAASRAYADIGMLWRLGVSLVLGLAMLFALAFVLAARARSAVNMQQWMVGLTMLLVGLGGGFFPPQMVSAPVQALFDAVPSTWMIQAISADLTGATPTLSIYAVWGLMGVCAVLALWLASRFFSWDRESRTRRARSSRARLNNAAPSESHPRRSISTQRAAHDA